MRGFGGMIAAAALLASALAATALPDLSGPSPDLLAAPELEEAATAPQAQVLEALVKVATADLPDGIDLRNISYSVDGEVQTVPLPAGLPALLLALGALGLLARRWTVS